MNKKNIHSFIFVFAMGLTFSLSLMAQNPTVVDGVATYHSDKNIGKKFLVPDSWDKVVIKANVTITGSFYMPNRTKFIEFAGEDRETSRIQGDGSRPTDDGKNGRTYSTIRGDKSPEMYIHDLYFYRPYKFHIHSGFGKLLVERCNIVTGGEVHSSDGIHGGRNNTVVRDCFIDVYDDATYTSECTLIENTTIIHNKNGSPFMVSWSYNLDPGEKCVIRNCTVISNYSDSNYAHGVIGWAGKSGSDLDIMHVAFEGTFTREVNPGKTVAPMYSIGRNNGNTINNCQLLIDGLCPTQNSIDIRSGAQNCKVSFINCDTLECEGNSAPTVSITAPSNGASFGSNENITISSDASDIDGDILWVEFLDSDNSLGIDNSSPFSISTQLAAGSHTLTAIATDNCGATTISDSITISVTAVIPDLPGRIEAENYTSMSGIDTESTSDAGGGKNIGWINNNDFASYRVNVLQAGTYTLKARVASENSGGSIEISSNVGNHPTVLLPVPATGGWQSWVTESTNITLNAGMQTLQLDFIGGSGFLFNLNWVEVSEIPSEIQPISKDISEIYPNPVSDYLTIESKYLNNSILQILNSSGQLVYQFQEIENEIYVGALPPGLYYIRVIHSNHSFMHSFVKDMR